MRDRESLESGMRRALELARRGPAGDANPQVGCVVLDPAGRIVTEGWHHGAGTPHAEVDALDHLPTEWRDRAGELTAIVTLEPCNHTGRTGPCARRLVETGIGAVAYALDDPSPIAGGGAETLRAAGVEVQSGVLEAAARDLLAPWFERQTRSLSPVAAPVEAPGLPAISTRSMTGNPGRNRPHVIVKWAQTLDGRAAAADGSSQWITGPEARADVHRRRAAADAILVGTGTLLADDPTLTARDADGSLLVPAAKQPLPVVLGHRDIPAGARILHHPALATHGLDAPLRFTGEDLASDLDELGARGIRSVFIEGGPTVASAILAAGLADEVLVYVAPALLGGPRLALDELRITSMSEILRLDAATLERLGDDILLNAHITRSKEGS